MPLTNTYAANVVPMFQPIKKENFMAQPSTDTELSVFDVKELYDKAYDQKANGADNETFQKLMAEALQADMAYRRQLLKNTPHRQIKSAHVQKEKENSRVA